MGHDVGGAEPLPSDWADWRELMMRTVTKGAVLVMLLSGFAVLAAENGQKDYWGRIKAHLQAAGQAPSRESAAVQAAYAYLDSLSAEQLVIAARQASEDVMKEVPREQWPEAWLVLAFFYQYYPPKVDNLSDVEPLLAEVEDGSQPEFWRWWLARTLTVEWDRHDQLTDEQRGQVSERLLRLAQQPEVPAYIREEVVRGVPRLLRSMKKALPPLKEGEEPGEARKRFAAVSRGYVKVAGALLAQKATPLEVQREALKGLLLLHQMSPADSTGAAKAVGKAARDYSTCAEELWPALLLAAFTTDPATDVAPLVSQAEKAAKEQKALDRLRTVRRVVAIKGLATQKPAAGDVVFSRRLDERSTEELLAMMRWWVDNLAGGNTSDQAWSALDAIVQEYMGRKATALSH